MTLKELAKIVPGWAEQYGENTSFDLGMNNYIDAIEDFVPDIKRSVF